MLSVMNRHEKEMAVQEQPSNYINNMMLPEMVQATRQNPLGPDCIISSTEVTDQALLNAVHYYWYISREKGCVECVMKKSRIQENVAASDPRCVVTRKNRRFEAYCCMLCRQNFVTIVQALLHLKAIHRPTSKILIQDKDIFHNIDKAMEVPPVPLPWHIAKKIVEHEKSPVHVNVSSITDMGATPTFVIPPGALSSGNVVPTSIDSVPSAIHNVAKFSPMQRQSPSPPKINEQNNTEEIPTKGTMEMDQNPMVCIIAAIVGEFNKQISHLAFNDNCSQANATFVDGKSVIAKTPDLVNSVDGDRDQDMDDLQTDIPLSFSVTSEDLPDETNSNTKIITLRANQPALARKLFASTIAQAPNKEIVKKQSSSPRGSRSSSESEHDAYEQQGSPAQKRNTPVESKRISTKQPNNRPVKSVRFMLGAPDSSDEERPETPEHRDQSHQSSTSKEPPLDGVKADDTFDGLRDVVDELITTASKGRIMSLPPTSPLTTSASLNSFTPSSTLPLVGSSPALSNMVSATNKGKASSLTRVQSWSPSISGTSFSVASMRRPYTARGFTYAEKIELMKQQNDYDAEFISKHIRKKGKPDLKTSDEATSDTDSKLPEGYSGRGLGDIKSYEDSENNSDSDESPPTLINNVNAVAAAYSNLLQSGLLTSSMFSPDRYYGSGEWASAAMETLKSLQSTIQSQEEPILSPKHSASDLPLAGFKVKEEHPDSIATFVDDHKLIKPERNPQRESLSDDNSSQSSRNKQLKVKLPHSRKRCKSNNESNTPLEEQHHIPQSPPKRRKFRKAPVKPDTDANTDSDTHPEQTAMSALNARTVIPESPEQHLEDDNGHHIPRQKYLHKTVDKVSKHSAKVPLSPLLSSAEKDLILHQQKPTSKTKAASQTVCSITPLKETREEIRNPFVSPSTSKSLGTKCSSDPALSSSSTSENCVSTSASIANLPSPRVQDPGKPRMNAKSSRVSQNDSDGSAILKSGDSLVFLKDVSITDFTNMQPILTRLQTNEDSTERNSVNKTMMNVPEVFRNCIETCVKIQCVQKVHVCKVCGFSVAVMVDEDKLKIDGGVGKALQAHVMEHSLKELYATGYEMGNW